jgi:maltose-binding protein MalE
VELNLTAYSKISSILNEYVMYALNGQMTPEEALAEAAKLANEEITNAK